MSSAKGVMGGALTVLLQGPQASSVNLEGFGAMFQWA